MIFAFLGVFTGCSSDSSGPGAPLEKKKAKPLISLEGLKPLQVVEILPETHEKGGISKKLRVPQNIEVIPPANPGERGITQAELNLSGQGKLDPATIEVIPPDEPGKRGITQAELNLSGQEKLDPATMEVIPPDEPGKRGITQAELESLTAGQENVDLPAGEPTPPDRP